MFNARSQQHDAATVVKVIADKLLYTVKAANEPALAATATGACAKEMSLHSALAGAQRK